MGWGFMINCTNMKKTLAFLTFFVASAVLLSAQEALKSTEEEYYSFLSMNGIVETPTLGYRTLSDSVWSFDSEGDDADHIWKDNNLGTKFTLWQPENPAENFFTRGFKQGLFVKVYGPEWFNSYNTNTPYGQNDGALWQGRGYNTALTAGVRLEAYGFELTFKPQVSFSQNKDFTTNASVYPNPYSYTFSSDTVTHYIDHVQRYGANAFWNYDWGDSEIRWTWHSLTFGFGTQNPWLGPAYLNPMLGSNNAAGYLKFDAGLRKTQVVIPGIDLNLGYIEGRIWVGQLKQSDYFDFVDSNPAHRNRMLTAMSASYNPSFIPGLTIGLNRVFMTYWRTENLKYIWRLFTTSRSNDVEDQKFALFAEWSFPKAGFTVYGELGIDDFSSDEKGNPFHTAIYTVGAKQVIPVKLTKLFPKWKNAMDLTSELIVEWNNFEMSQDFQLQWTYLGYYAHSPILQGYTHKGQILGAGSGAFGNSQFIQYKVYYPKGYTALKFHRYCPNNNSVYSQAVGTIADSNSDFYRKWYANFETYLCLGLETDFYVQKKLNIKLSIDYILHRNPYYFHHQEFHGFNFLCEVKYVF